VSARCRQREELHKTVTSRNNSNDVLATVTLKNPSIRKRRQDIES